MQKIYMTGICIPGRMHPELRDQRSICGMPKSCTGMPTNINTLQILSGAIPYIRQQQRVMIILSGESIWSRLEMILQREAGQIGIIMEQRWGHRSELSIKPGMPTQRLGDFRRRVYTGKICSMKHMGHSRPKR